MAGELNIYQKLNLVQTELKAPKGQWNDYSKFNYRSAEDILEAVKPLNHKYGLNLTMSDDTKIESNGWAYLVATGILVNIDNPHEKIDATGRAREAQAKKGMDESQITGTASSYARKYMLNGLYLIDDTKDADTNQYQQQQYNEPVQPAQQPQGQQAPPNQPTFTEWVNMRYDELGKLTGWDKEEITVMLEGKAGSSLKGLERERIVAVIKESIAEIKKTNKTSSPLNKALQDTKDKFNWG